MIELKSTLEADVEEFISHPESDAETFKCAVRELAGQLRSNQTVYALRAEASIKAAVEQREAFANTVLVLRGELEVLRNELKKRTGP